jgi:hypothetical protein
MAATGCRYGHRHGMRAFRRGEPSIRGDPMKSQLAMLGLALCAAAATSGQTPPATSDDTTHRYIVERTFPAGALTLTPK